MRSDLFPRMRAVMRAVMGAGALLVGATGVGTLPGVAMAEGTAAEGTAPVVAPPSASGGRGPIQVAALGDMAPVQGGCGGLLGVCTWEITYGDSRPNRAADVALMPDGGAVVVGATEAGYGRKQDGLILRIAPDGAFRWVTSPGGPEADRLHDVAVLPGGHVVVVGETRSHGEGGADLWILRLDSAGDVVWETTHGAPGNDRAYGVAVAPDGGVIAVGHAKPPNTPDGVAVVLRIEAEDGEITWLRHYGGAADDSARDVAVAPDGRIALAGYTGSRGAGGLDGWVALLDEDGTALWERTFGGPGFEAASSVVFGVDGSIGVAGRTMRMGSSIADAVALRYEADGTLAWQRDLGGAGDDLALAITPVQEAGAGTPAFIVGGYTASAGAGSADAWLVAMDAASGADRWEATFGGALWEMVTGLSGTPDGGAVASGYTTSVGSGFEDFYVVRVNAAGAVIR